MRKSTLLPRVAIYAILGVWLSIVAISVSSRLSSAGALPDSFSVDVQVGDGGAISPSGVVKVAYGRPQTFRIIPDECFRIGDVLVDGESAGPVATYRFASVQTDHTISASFARRTLTITASANTGGTIAPSGVLVDSCGIDATFAITRTCGTLTDVVVDGVSIGPVATYLFSAPTSDHTITASFSLPASTTTLEAVPAPASCSRPDTLIAHVEGADEGLVQFYDGNQFLIIASLSNGDATAPLGAPLHAGDHTLTAKYAGSGCALPSQSPPLALHVDAPAGETTYVDIAASSDTSIDATPVTLIATFRFSTSPSNYGQGTVSFFDGDALLGIMPGGGGYASFTTAALDTGAHILTARYDGDGCFAPATSAVVAHVVVPIVPPPPHAGTLQLVSTANPIHIGQSVGFTGYVVADNTALAQFATGTVEFFEGSTLLTSAAVDSGIATATIAGLAIGDHWIRANYSGESHVTPATWLFYLSVIDALTPDVLAQFDAVAIGGGIRITWQISRSALSVDLQRSESPSGPWRTIAAARRPGPGGNTFQDDDVASAQAYWYRLVTMTAGQQVVLGMVSGIAGTPNASGIVSIWPNPTARTALITFAQASRGHADLRVLDLAGRVVLVLVDGEYGAGVHRIPLDASLGTRPLPAGMYFVRFHDDAHVETRPLVIVR